MWFVSPCDVHDGGNLGLHGAINFGLKFTSCARYVARLSSWHSTRNLQWTEMLHKFQLNGETEPMAKVLQRRSVILFLYCFTLDRLVILRFHCFKVFVILKFLTSAIPKLESSKILKFQSFEVSIIKREISKVLEFQCSTILKF